ncbi:MAG: hypothetical protein DIU69_06685 [Bacillota bacterium]|nr:MAG: hypothetical protein DIU69_06685 [Bacillota bacterium]
MGGQGSLAISVETHPAEFARTLEQDRLVYRVFRSRQRWVFVTDFLPQPAAEAASRFLHRVVLPEMLLEHIDIRYEDVDPGDRLVVWKRGTSLLEQPSLARATAVQLQTHLVEHGSLSIAGWMRFRGERFFRALLAELARTGFQQLWLERALRQFLGALQAGTGDRPEVLTLCGSGDDLEIRTGDGRPAFREFLEGHLDPRLKLGREDLAVGLLRALAPRRVIVRDAGPELVAKLREAGINVEKAGGNEGDEP